MSCCSVFQSVFLSHQRFKQGLSRVPVIVLDMGGKRSSSAKVKTEPAEKAAKIVPGGLLKASSCPDFETWKNLCLKESWAHYKKRSDAWIVKQYHRVQEAMQHPDVGGFQQWYPIPRGKTLWVHNPKETVDNFEAWLCKERGKTVTFEGDGPEDDAARIDDAKTAHADVPETALDQSDVSDETKNVPIGGTSSAEGHGLHAADQPEKSKEAEDKVDAPPDGLPDTVPGLPEISNTRTDEPAVVQETDPARPYAGSTASECTHARAPSIKREDENKSEEAEDDFQGAVKKAVTHPAFSDFMRSAEYANTDISAFGSRGMEDLLNFNEFIVSQGFSPLTLLPSSPHMTAVKAKAKPIVPSQDEEQDKLESSQVKAEDDNNQHEFLNSSATTEGLDFPLEDKAIEDLYDDETAWLQAVSSAKAHQWFPEYWKELSEELDPEDLATYEFGHPENDGDPVASFQHWAAWLKKKMDAEEAERGLAIECASAEARVVYDIEITSALKNGWPSIFVTLPRFEPDFDPRTEGVTKQLAGKPNKMQRRGNQNSLKILFNKVNCKFTKPVTLSPNPPSPVSMLQLCHPNREMTADELTAVDSAMSVQAKLLSQQAESPASKRRKIESEKAAGAAAVKTDHENLAAAPHEIRNDLTPTGNLANKKLD